MADPSRIYSQAELRDRRRKWLRHTYTGSFDLAAEVGEIVAPLAGQVAALPCPLAMRNRVEDVRDGVHEVLSVVIGLLAESRLDADAHARTVQAVRDFAQRPREPQLSDDAILTGRWSGLLVRHISPHSADFAAFLGRALPPDDPRLSGPSASERLEAVLRELDSAALTLERAIPKVAAHQSLPSFEEVNAANRAKREAERADRMLAKMMKGSTP